MLTPLVKMIYLKDKEPVQIKAGEKIKLKMDYTPKPNKIHLTQIKNGEQSRN